MEAPHILIDTSIIVEHLRKRNKRKSLLYSLIETHVLYTSTIVEFELFAGATNARKQQDIHDILSLFHILPLTSDIAQQAASIYQDLKKNNEIIEVGDILIAATTIHANLPIMTMNTTHFQRIEGVTLLPLPSLRA